MRTIFYILSAFVLFLLVSCSDNPYVSKEEIDKIRENNKTKLYNIAIIFNNDVYLLPRQDSVALQLTHTPSAVKTNIKINHHHSKIAYINNNGNPVIIDTKGNVIATLTQFKNIKSMDWSYDDASLYFLIGNEFMYYGTKMTPPTFTYPIPKVSDPYYSMTDEERNFTVLSASISVNNDLAYIFQYSDRETGTHQKLVVKTTQSALIEKDVYPENLDYVNFSGNNTDLVVGQSNNSDKEYLDNLRLYEELQFTKYSFENFDLCNNPCYRSDLQFLIYQKRDKENGKFSLYAMSLDGLHPSQVIEPFSNSSGRIYVDWK